MTVLIEVDRIAKTFGDVSAVDGVSLTVETGEVVGLVGANGAGKTTLIRMVLGLVRPSFGRILLFGEPPSREGRARLGYVPQGAGLYEDLTVAENLSFIAGAFGAPRPRLDPELESIRDQPVGQISLGLRRRTAFAGALSHRPDLLLLDEPTSGVGPLGRTELWTTIASAASAGAGVLVTTHHMEEAEQCDRVIMLSSGHVVAEGNAAAIAGAVESVAVTVDDWRAAFSALEDVGVTATLRGSQLRVTGAAGREVLGILTTAGIKATVRPVETGFEEAFVALSSG